jgi:type IV pilus assembly protein PilM
VAISVNTGIREGIYRSALVRGVSRWLDVVPHPLVACEIAPGYVAAARWARGGLGLEGFAIESLPPGAIVPSAVETNILMVAEVRSTVGRVFARLRTKGQVVALLVPDPVVPVFVLHFDTFPRRRAEAEPLLRWRLKKSTPFEAEETIISFMRQAPREEGVDIVTALARLRIVREYEQLMQSVGMSPGVVLSSTLAALPLLEDRRPSLLARVSGKNLTTAITRGGIMWNYRCIELPGDVSELSPQTLLDEIYPVTTYYQDTWKEGLAAVRLAGLGARVEEFREPLERELNCPAASLLASAASEGRLGNDQQPLADRDLDALVGWTLNRGA